MLSPTLTCYGRPLQHPALGRSLLCTQPGVGVLSSGKEGRGPRWDKAEPEESSFCKQAGTEPGPGSIRGRKWERE